MKPHPGHASAVLAFSAAILSAAPFDPEEHFPKESLYFLSVDAGVLREGFRSSPFGKLLFHPGVEKAFAGARDKLLEKIRSETTELTSMTGLDIFQILNLFSGKVALTVPAINMLQGPQLIVSADLGAKRKEIEALVARLGSAFVAATGGGELSTAEVKGVQVTTWPVQFGPSIQHAILGETLVFSVGESMETVIGRFQSREGSDDALRRNETFARAKLQGSVASPAVTLFIDWGKIRDFASQVAPGEGAGIMAALGIDKLQSALARVGFRDGDFEAKVILDSPGGLSGFLGEVAESIGPGEDETALSRVPAASLEIGSQSLATGKLVRAIVDLKLGIPEAAADIDALVSKLEEATGLSVEKDLYPLPRLGIYSFNALPPGGGFVPDTCAIVRTSQFQPYLVLLDRVARKIGAEVRSIPMEGKEIAYLSAGKILSRLGLAPPAGAPDVPRPDPVQIFGMASGGEKPIDPSMTLAFAPIDADWMVIASTPQSVGRYFSSHSKATPLSADEASTALLRKEVGKDAPFTFLRGGRHLIFAWNTALALAMVVSPTLEKELAELGIDPAYLPPGEELAPAFRDGFYVLRRTNDGLVFHGHRVLSNLVGSPTLASALLAYGLETEIAKNAGAPAKSVAEERLRKLGEALRKHAETAGNGAYPRDDQGGLPSLQALVDAGLIGPGDLVHPRGEKPAQPGEEGKIVLDTHHVSYALVAWKQGPTDSPGRLLAYEKKPYEGTVRRALFVDGSVRSMDEGEFQELLEGQAARYGRREPGEEGK